MKILTSPFRFALFALALPAALTFSACGDDDDDNNRPQQGRVLISHAAAAADVQVTAFITDQQVGQLNYGQSTSYLNVNAGTPTLRLNNGTQVAASQALTIAANQNYSVFAYSPTAAVGSVELLPITDDLTAPVSGQVKIRLVHLAVGAPSPVRLTVPSAIPTAPGTDLTPDVAFGTASNFVALNPGQMNLVITDNGTPRTQVLTVGDGTGTGTGVKNYEAGRIYTVVVRGISGGGVPTAQQPKAIIIQNN